MPISYPCQRLLGQVKDALRILKESGPEAAEEVKGLTEQLQNLPNDEASDNEYRFSKYLAADKITIKDLGLFRHRTHQRYLQKRPSLSLTKMRSRFKKRQIRSRQKNTSFKIERHGEMMII